MGSDYQNLRRGGVYVIKEARLRSRVISSQKAIANKY